MEEYVKVNLYRGKENEKGKEVKAMQISSITSRDVYNTVSYVQNTAEVQQPETEEVQEAVQTASEPTTSAIANVQELYEAQQGAAASVNITQVDTSNAQVVTQGTSSSAEEDEETTTTKLVFNSDGSVEQVTITTDADGNETEERVQISGPTEATGAGQAEDNTSDVREGGKPDKKIN